MRHKGTISSAFKLPGIYKKQLHIFHDLDTSLVVSTVDNHIITQIICPGNLIWPFGVGCESLGSKVVLV